MSRHFKIMMNSEERYVVYKRFLWCMWFKETEYTFGTIKSAEEQLQLDYDKGKFIKHITI